MTDLRSKYFYKNSNPILLFSFRLDRPRERDLGADEGRVGVSSSETPDSHFGPHGCHTSSCRSPQRRRCLLIEKNLFKSRSIDHKDAIPLSK